MLCLPLFHVHGLCAGLVRHADCGCLRRRVRPLRRGGDPAGGADEHHVLRRPDHVPPPGGDGTGRPHWGRCACASRARRRWRADLWHSLAGDGVDVLERYGMTETLLTLSNPLVGERRPGSVGPPAARRGGRARRHRRERHRRAPRARARRCAGATGAGTLRPARDWFATGDLVSVADDGYVTVRGRRTELIITGGHNVYPAEVEAVLSRHPGVVEVAVVGVPSAEWGETVVAYVVGDPDLGLAPRAGGSRAGTVQVPARGAADRRAAAQCAGQGRPERAPLTGRDRGAGRRLR